MITNWDDWEKLLHHGLYNELRVAPEEHLVVMAQPPLAPKAEREKITQIMFETFNVPMLLLSPASVLSCIASGRPSGLVLLGGHLSTTVAPVYCGHELSHAVASSVFGALDVRDKLAQLMGERGWAMTTTAELAIVQDILVRHGRVRPSRDALDSSLETRYELPDGQVLMMGEELWQAPETLFEGSEDATVRELATESLEKLDRELHRTMLSNVVLSGGSTCFPGFAERTAHELGILKVVAPAERKYLPWIGASILGSMSTAIDMAVSKEEYDEYGPQIASRKFL